jgi:hypothetical protein
MCLLLKSDIPREYDLAEAFRQVDEAVGKGWKATVVLPHFFDKRSFRTPDGHRGVICPAILHDHVTCNDCGMCDVERNTGIVIGFPDHGATAGGIKGLPPMCYSQFGTPAIGFTSSMVPRSAEKPEEYTLEYALDNAVRSAKFFRWAALGNTWPAITKRRFEPVVGRIRSADLGFLSYEHRAWKVKPGQWMRDYTMASCDGLRKIA